MVVSYSGIAGKRGYNPNKIVIHNDGGSKNATASFYQTWLESHTPELGFAHDYVCSDGTYHAEDYENKAWHTGQRTGNNDYIGIEVCQSLGDEATFKANEQKAFELAAEICKKFGLNPDYSIFPLHKELLSTDCPHRSWDLHGKAIAAVRQYYTDQVKKYMGTSSGGSTGLAPNSKPLKDGKVGDTVKVYNTLYLTATGGGPSTKMRGKQGVIKRIVGNSKKYLIEDWGWAHPNDIQLVKRASSGTSAQTKTVTIDSLNVYTSQSLSSAIVKTANGYRILKKGTKVKVTGTLKGQSVHGSTSWSEVDGWGWVPSVYLM